MRHILKNKAVGSGLVLLLALATAAVIVILTDRPGAKAHDVPGARPALVRVVHVERVPGYMASRTYTGRIQARRTSDLGFEQSAKLIEVAVEEGASVKAGEVLARLDTRQLEARKQSLVAERAAAQAVLDELVAGPRQEDIDAAQAEVERQVALLARLKIRRERIEALRGQNAANQDELDEIRFEYRAAQAALAGAKAELSELNNGTRPEQLASQRARVAVLEASITTVNIDLEDSVLVAPFDGRVQRRLVDEGSVVSPAQPVLTLVKSGSREATVGVPWDVAQDLVVGQVAMLYLGSLRIEAELQAILPMLDEATRTVEIVLALPESVAGDKPGSIVRWALPESIGEQGFWLPTTALARGSRGLWSALVVNDQSVIERVDLEVLHTETQRVFVRGAVMTGDRIVAKGRQRLAVGQRVEVSASSGERQ